MDLLNQVTDIMNKYAAGGSGAVPGSVNADFDRLSQHAPSASLSEGLAEAFGSRETPPFASMLSRDAETNVLSTLVATLGPTVVSQILQKHGAERAANELQRGQTQVSPQTAEQCPPGSIEAVAREAEKKDPPLSTASASSTRTSRRSSRRLAASR